MYTRRLIVRRTRWGWQIRVWINNSIHAGWNPTFGWHIKLGRFVKAKSYSRGDRMKTRDALTDDDGTRWEFLYDTLRYQEQVEGQIVELTRAVDFRYRRLEGERDTAGEWAALPPWADVAEQWKITLCFFDEDEESGEMTFWEVLS